MTIESSADRLEILKTLGEAVTFNNGQSSWDVYGIIERDFVVVDGVESNRPIFTCREEDTTSHATMLVAHGTTLQADAGSFTVVSIQADGTGMVALVLERI